MKNCGTCYGCVEYGRCGSQVETALERAEREELEQWGAAQLEAQEDRKVVQVAALTVYCEEMAGQTLGEVAQRRLRAAHKLLNELRR